MGLREKQPRDEEKRFRNISLPRVIPHSGRKDGKRSLSVFPGGRVEAAQARKHSSCEDALLLNLMITGEEDETGRARGLTALRYRRPRDLAGIPNQVTMYSRRDLFPAPHMGGKCTAGARRLLEHLSRHFVLIFDHFSKKKEREEQKTHRVNQRSDNICVFFFHYAARSGRLLRSNEFEKKGWV